jgi:hypothetical protein
MTVHWKKSVSAFVYEFTAHAFNHDNLKSDDATPLAVKETSTSVGKECSTFWPYFLMSESFWYTTPPTRIM